MNSKQNHAVFSAATDSEHKIIQILHRKGQKKMWTELSSLGQEPTFKTRTRFSLPDKRLLEIIEVGIIELTVLVKSV